MERLVIKYSRDLRKSRLIGNIYEILRDRGLDPAFVNSSYSVSLGIGEAVYIFKHGTILPKKSELEKMLKGMNFLSLEIVNSGREEK